MASIPPHPNVVRYHTSWIEESVQVSEMHQHSTQSSSPNNNIFDLTASHEKNITRNSFEFEQPSAQFSDCSVGYSDSQFPFEFERSAATSQEINISQRSSCPNKTLAPDHDTKILTLFIQVRSFSFTL